MNTLSKAMLSEAHMISYKIYHEIGVQEKIFVNVFLQFCKYRALERGVALQYEQTYLNPIHPRMIITKAGSRLLKFVNVFTLS